MDGNQEQAVTASAQNAQNQNTNLEKIDYEKIQGMIDNRNQRNEDSILKDYFKRQGLSEDDMKEAITSFKNQKQVNSQKDIEEKETLQNQLNESNSKYQKLQIESEAYKQAIDLKVDKKTIPYLIKMADFKGCLDEKGNITPEKVKEALNQVLTDIPTLKSNEDESKSGVQVGADSSNQAQPNGTMFDFGFAGVRKH